MQSFKRPLVAYVLLAYAITWGGIAAYLATKGFRLQSMTEADLPVVAVPMLLGPSIAGLALIAGTQGRHGLVDLARRLRRWRGPAATWAVALGTNPIVTVAVLGALALTVSPSFRPGFMPTFLLVGIVAGTLEEIGWTGFATHRLLRHWSPTRAGFALGVVWATWHAAADISINGAGMGSAWLPYFLVYWVAILVPYRILMTWVYARTGSVLTAILMHASYTGWQGCLAPATTTAETFLWQAALAVAMAVTVGLIVRRGLTFQAGPFSTGSASRAVRSLEAHP